MEELSVEQLQAKTEEIRRQRGIVVKANGGEPNLEPAVMNVVRRIRPWEPPPPPPPPTPEEIEERRRWAEERRRQDWLSDPPDVPSRYNSARFANWQRKGKSVEAARQVVQRWVKDVSAGKPSMVALIGPQGTSKSHLLACATWELFETHEIRPDFHEWYVTVDELRDLDTAKKTRARLHRAKVLVLDEARPTSGTDFDAMELSKIAMWAYAHERSVLLATNWSSLPDLMGAPAADRFTVVPITGPSAR